MPAVKARRTIVAPKAQRVSAPPTPTSAASWPYVLPALALCLLVFGQTIGFDFVNWDDDVNILDNRAVTTFDWTAIWTQTVIGNYNPLPIFTFAVEYALVGAEAALYHANNLLLHLVNVVLVFALGRYLRLGPLAAGGLAALFAIHPMRVESVAWVTERKDVLFAAFYLGALLVYERRRRGGAGRSWSWWVGGLFVLALLSKVQAVSLPLAMLCLDYLRQREVRWREVLAKAPYFALSLAVGLAGVYFLSRDGSLADATGYAPLDRLAVGAYAYLTYLAKAVWPYRMSPLYPYPAALPWQAYAALPGTLAVLGLGAWGYWRAKVALVFGLAFFSVNVVFLLQVLGAGQGYLADRFTYVGYLGLFWGIAYGLQALAQKRVPGRYVGAGAVGYLLLLSALAFRQTKVWRDGDVLWAHVADHFPHTATAYGNRAQWLREHGDAAAALALFDRAIAARPDDGAYYNSRGKLHFDENRNELALADYTAGIAVEPALGELYINRGAALAKASRFGEARRDLDRGLELDPENFNGYLNRSLLLLTVGEPALALEDYAVLLAMRPERHDLWAERGNVRAQTGDSAGARADLEEAIDEAKNDRSAVATYRQLLANL